MKKQDCEQLTLFQADSPVNRSVLPGSEEARKMTVTSGRKCLELYQNSGPLGLLVRMLLGSSIWRSTRCTLTWKTKVTPCKRLLFRLVPSMRRIGGTDAPLWPTVTTDSATQRTKRYKQGGLPLTMAVNMFPTPTRFDATCGDLKGKEYAGTRHAMKLIQAAKMWRTPTATDAEGRGTYASYDAYKRRLEKGKQISLANQVKFQELWLTPTTGAGLCGGTGNFQQLKKLQQAGQITEEERRNMSQGNGGQLNPTWVEWLMGFPIGWTDLNASETP